MLIALLNLSFWCLVMVERLFLAVPWGSLQFVIVVFPDHTHLLFLANYNFNAVSFIVKTEDIFNEKFISSYINGTSFVQSSKRRQ